MTRSVGWLSLALASLVQVNAETAEIPRACTGEFQTLPFCNTSLSTGERVDDLLSRLSVREKALMLTARASPAGNVSTIGLPEYNWGANCVHGVQSTCGTNCATNFPNPVNLGAAFDMQLVYDMAQVIGWELRALWLEGARENYAKGPHLGLDCWSPNININRDPRWGRNMEAPSEDPFINGRYGVAYTRGLQEGKDPRYLQAVVTLKHWAAYSFEHYGGVDRMEFDAKVSRYDLADTYFPAFRSSVMEGRARGVMCSYNSVNGVPACSNEFLTAVLRKHWKFDGYITSDSGAVRAIYDKHHYTQHECDAGKLALERGTDVNSGGVYRHCVEQLVRDGQLREEAVDEAIRRTLKLRFELGLFDPIEDQPYWHVKPSEVNGDHARNLSLNATRKSLVLLQNNKNVLPVQKGAKLAVIGPHASTQQGMMGNYYGQICHGDYLELGCVETPLEAIRRLNGADNVIFAAGCGMNDSSKAGFDEAAKAVARADVAFLFLGIDTTIEREAADRTNIELPHTQMELLKHIRRLKKPVVVVLFNGGIVGAEEMVLHTDAIVEAFYPGFFGAQAVAEVLFGDYNPGGKLPVTMYRSDFVEHVPMGSMNMTEFPGRTYRYFKDMPVFPFGWGLSYTSFQLRSKNDSQKDSFILKNSSGPLRIPVEVQNTGSRYGDEVVLAFFQPLEVNVTGPATQLNQQLFFFKRVSLDPQASCTVEIDLDQTMLAMADEGGNMYIFPGFYQILVTNGVDERLSYVVHIGEKRLLYPFPDAPSSLAPHEHSSPINQIEDIVAVE